MSKRDIDPEFKDVYKFPWGKLFLIIVLLCAICGCIYYFFFYKKVKIDVTSYFETSEEKKNTIDEKKNSKNKIYYYKVDNKIVAYDKSNKKEEYINTYVCSGECSNLDIDSNYALILDNDEVIVFDLDNTTSTSTGYTGDTSDLKLVYSKDSLLGLMIQDGAFKYYSFESKKVEYASAQYTLSDDSNFADYGYLVLLSIVGQESYGFLNLKTYNIDKTSDVEIKFYNDFPVKQSGYKYIFLDNNLDDINKKYMYLREDAYLVNNVHYYYKVDFENKTLDKVTYDYKVIDIVNNLLLVNKNDKAYIINNNNKVKIVSLDGLEYNYNMSSYDKDSKKYNLVFSKDDNECTKYIYDESLQFVEKTSVECQ